MKLERPPGWARPHPSRNGIGKRGSGISCLAKAACLAAVLLGTALPVRAQALRPEVGKPLQQAGELLRAGKAREALARCARRKPSATARAPSS
jgi:hypothetical protein